MTTRLPSEISTFYFRSMINRANHQLLSRHSDVTIDTRYLWRVLVRHYYQPLPPLIHPPGIPNHNALFFSDVCPSAMNRDPAPT